MANISDLTTPGQNAYSCQIKHGNVKVVAMVRSTVVRRGAYEMTDYAANTTRAALGARQQARAVDMKLEARGALTSALHAAGWHSERITYGGSELVLWWPAVQA